MDDQSVPAFERYRQLIPGFHEFLDALRKPLPVVIRANTLKIETEPFRILMAARGYDLEPVGGVGEAFTLRGIETPGFTLEYFLGLYHIQGVTSMLPPKILEPRPGESILDLCAAPGGKTTHLAQLIKNRSLLVANEPNSHRVNILRSHLDRLGAASVLVSRYDGSAFPTRRKFQRVLLDPPCSAEGTYRLTSRYALNEAPQKFERLSGLQRALLGRALDVLEPGGILVYCTCTYAPEENESVVNSAVLSGRAEVLPIHIPLPHSPGLQSWEGKAFHPDLTRTVRIYPHQVNARGFFIARLRRR